MKSPKKKRKDFSYPNKLLAAFRNGDRCSICNKLLVLDYEDGSAKCVGQAAHIAGEQPGAARYDEHMTDRERLDYKNLIYLCRDCHAMIDDLDKGVKNYPTKKLLSIKQKHEAKMRKAMLDAFPDVNFPALFEATKWVERFRSRVRQGTYSLLKVDAKLKRNDISTYNRVVIEGGLGVTKEVGAYVQDVSKDDDGFADRLKFGFMEEYARLRKENIKGDPLFEGMCSFAQRGMERQVDRTAALAVLVYFFEKCEVFEK